MRALIAVVLLGALAARGANEAPLTSSGEGRFAVGSGAAAAGVMGCDPAAGRSRLLSTLLDDLSNTASRDPSDLCDLVIAAAELGRVHDGASEKVICFTDSLSAAQLLGAGLGDDVEGVLAQAGSFGARWHTP